MCHCKNEFMNSVCSGCIATVNYTNTCKRHNRGMRDVRYTYLQRSNKVILLFLTLCGQRPVPFVHFFSIVWSSLAAASVAGTIRLRSQCGWTSKIYFQLSTDTFNFSPQWNSRQFFFFRFHFSNYRKNMRVQGFTYHSTSAATLDAA